MKKIALFVKRFLDIVLSLAGIVLLAPFFLLIMLGIKLTSKGPVFFRQARLGMQGKIFKIIKFRTMIVNAEHMGDGVCVYEKTDQRITKIGRFLRSTSLDELPQLFNVLLGDMSLVGPRPPVVYHPYDGYENYPDWAKKRFRMRPGMTGLVQVTVRSDTSWDERMVIDNQYIDTFCLLLDLKILIGTIKTVIRSKAY